MIENLHGLVGAREWGFSQCAVWAEWTQRCLIILITSAEVWAQFWGTAWTVSVFAWCWEAIESNGLWPFATSSQPIGFKVFLLILSTPIKEGKYLMGMRSFSLLALYPRHLPGGRGSRRERHCRYFASPWTALTHLRITFVPWLCASPATYRLLQ